MRSAYRRILLLICLLLSAGSFVPSASADEPIILRANWKGDVSFFATGTALAESTDGDNMIDTDIQPQSVIVRAVDDVPVGAVLEQAFVYWAGSRNQGAVPCAGTGSSPDDDVELTVPGGTPKLVVADTCYCSDGGNAWHDQWLCRYDMTDDIEGAGGQLTGTYTVGKAQNADGTNPAGRFVYRMNNSATEMASFSIVLVYRHDSAGVRHVLLYDGDWEMSESAATAEHQAVTFTLSDFEVDSPPVGDLTYYIGEGDGPTGGSENVVVAGSGAPVDVNGPLTLSDAVNSATNPFNRTINTVTPARTGVIGVDIDQFDISPALDAGDTRLDVTYDASNDKVFLLYNIIGIDVFEPLFSVRSYKTMTLEADNDFNNVPSPGDLVRFTIHLENTGNAQGTVSLSDPKPSQVTNWSLVANGGGNVVSTAPLSITNIVVPVGQSKEVIIDAVLADVPDETILTNIANYSQPLEGGAAGSVQVDVTIRKDGDNDGRFDNEDNCVAIANYNQFDADGDGVGDLCDPCPTDNPDDSDGDDVCDADDVCPGSDDGLDTDGDGVPNGCEICTGGNDTIDTDNDSVPDACDVCAAGDDRLDADSDGVPDACDVCAAGSDTADADNDDVPDACDICAAGDDTADADGDSVPDACDLCPAGSDSVDADSDGVPDACDSCTAGSDDADADADGVPDACDRCATGNDTADADNDGVPDACDICTSGNDSLDSDGDTVPDACDRCVAGDDAADADNDGVADACDACPGSDDTVDVDGDGVPDACSSELCSDQQDNNNDGLVDCEDPLCAGDPLCRSGEGDLFVAEPTPASGGTPAECGCSLKQDAHGSAGTSLFLLLAVGMLIRRRRR